MSQKNIDKHQLVISPIKDINNNNNNNNTSIASENLVCLNKQSDILLGKHFKFTNKISNERQKSRSAQVLSINSEMNLDFVNEKVFVNEVIQEKTTNVIIEHKKKSQRYENAYVESFSIDPKEVKRESLFFFTDEPIHIKIIGHEEEASLVLLHTNVYTIQINHAHFSWTIKRRYKNFLKLYEAYALFKTKLNIKNAAASAALTTNSLVFSATNTTHTPTSLSAQDQYVWFSEKYFDFIFKKKSTQIT